MANVPKAKENNTGFFNWLTTGKPSVTLLIGAVSMGSPNSETSVWISLVLLSREQRRMPILGPNNLLFFNIIYANPNKRAEKAAPVIIASYARTGLLGFMQILDTLVYSPVMLLAAIQLMFEYLYQFSGKLLGMFESKNTAPWYLWPFALIGFVIFGTLAMIFRTLVFLSKPYAKLAGFVLNIINIVPSVLVGVTTSISKFMTDSSRSSIWPSYGSIWKGVLVDIVCPFSTEVCKVLMNNILVEKGFNGSAAPPIPTPSWSTVIGYAVGAAVIGFLTFTTGGLGLISQPLLPWIAQFIGGAIAGGTAAAGVAATTTTFVATPTSVAIAGTAAVGIFGWFSSMATSAATMVKEWNERNIDQEEKSTISNSYVVSSFYSGLSSPEATPPSSNSRSSVIDNQSEERPTGATESTASPDTSGEPQKTEDNEKASSKNTRAL